MDDLTPAQCRAARALLGWGQRELEEKSGAAKKTIADFEAANRSPRADTLARLRKALERGGVDFIPENGGGAGVRLRARSPRAKRA